MSGIKHDQNKSDISMVSWELVELLGYVRMFGEKKYARDNWKQGFKISRSCAASLRHIFQFLSGETNDPESGLLHLGHAVAALEHAIYDMKHHPENDDRHRVSNRENSSEICAAVGHLVRTTFDPVTFKKVSTECLSCNPEGNE